MPILSNSSGNRHRAVLLPLGLLMLSMAVFGWGLQYKLSLYQGKDSITHLTPAAKLLSQKERPACGQVLSVRPVELRISRLCCSWRSGLRLVPDRRALCSNRKQCEVARAAPAPLPSGYFPPPSSSPDLDPIRKEPEVSAASHTPERGRFGLAVLLTSLRPVVFEKCLQVRTPTCESVSLSLFLHAQSSDWPHGLSSDRTCERRC